MNASPPPSVSPGAGWSWPGFALGIVLGMIPVVVAWILLGLGLHGGKADLTTALGYLTAALYAAEIVAAIVLITGKTHRSIGNGLLAMVFTGPVVWCVGCAVILSNGLG